MPNCTLAWSKGRVRRREPEICGRGRWLDWGERVSAIWRWLVAQGGERGRVLRGRGDRQDSVLALAQTAEGRGDGAAAQTTLWARAPGWNVGTVCFNMPSGQARDSRGPHYEEFASTPQCHGFLEHFTDFTTNASVIAFG